jgi:hypothetical protein
MSATFPPASTTRMGRITPCLWFDSQAEDAARTYCGIFPNSRIGLVTHYGEVGQEIHGRPPGSVLTVAFELDGQRAFDGARPGVHGSSPALLRGWMPGQARHDAVSGQTRHSRSIVRARPQHLVTPGLTRGPRFKRGAVAGMVAGSSPA